MIHHFRNLPSLAIGLLGLSLLALVTLTVTVPSAGAQATLGHHRLHTSNVFIRWGNDTAPPGTRLIYSGFAYTPAYAHSGQGRPIVMQAGDPGASVTLDGNPLYPLQKAPGADWMPPGITTECEVVAAVCEAPDLTTTIWGTHTAPPGWTVLYRGYSMGPHLSQDGGVIGPLCIDADAFDSSYPRDPNINARGLLYASGLKEAAVGSGDVPGGFVKCAVIMRD